MNKIVTDRMDELIQLCKAYHVKSMHAFGAVCTDAFNDRSDIDFLISFENLSAAQNADNYVDLHHKLQELFVQRIDLLTDLTISNPYTIERLEQTKQLIFEA
jgi:predicted nucleotidyltransferase